ncbi:MAG: hypothetical protein HYX60_03355 [Legionella longbeachae]|nr:hypothetical protein [Legionella longbeachae]
MPYLVKGNAQQLFQAFGQDWVIVEGKDDSGTISLDFTRTHFIGTVEQAIKHFNIWNQEGLGRYYLQGDMSAGNLWCLLGTHPLMKAEDEDPEIYHQNFIRKHFAYVSDIGESCGLMVMYRKDDPAKWMMGLVKKGYAAPKDREIILVSSFDLAPFIQSEDSEIKIYPVAFRDNELFQKIGSDLQKKLLQNAFNVESGEINSQFIRIDLLMRTLKDEQGTPQLSEPLPFSELPLSALFAVNPALDVIIQNKVAEGFPLSFSILKELLSDPSELCKEIEAIKLASNEKMNKHILRMLIIFYEKGILDKNRQLLNDLEFIKKFSGLMWDKVQIGLIPFLIQKEYDFDLMRLILSEESYYQAVDKLLSLEPALTKNIAQFFKDPIKLEELTFIHSLPNEECKMLCLLFWVKGALSIDGYQEIVNATKKYPLLASTLIALDKTKTITINDLRKLALDPRQHLPKSIAHHYAKELANFHCLRLSLNKLRLHELNAASSALMLLKKTGITESKAYHLVLGQDPLGQALRLFLPRLVTITIENQRKSLIDILYAGVRQGGNKVLAIKDPKQFMLAKSLHERFMCFTQTRSLKLNNEMIELAAEESSDEARRFRQVILQVEAQCKVIYERLSGSVSYREMLLKWQKEEANYRKTLYGIAYDALMKPNLDVLPRLKSAENKILSIVDPKIDSVLYNALIIITNIFITALTLSAANAIKYKMTGNFWFFNQTRSGEELRALDKEILELVELRK